MKKLTLFLIALMGITVIGTAQNRALQFDGTDDPYAPEYVNCGSTISSLISGNTLSVEAWIYPTDFKTGAHENTIVSNGTTTSTGFVLRFGGSGQLQFVIGNGSWGWESSSTGALSLNTWQHVAATYDGTSVRLYVNGVENNSTATNIPSSITASTNSLYIGESPGYPGRLMKGTIDELRIWTTTRTQTEIQDNMYTELSNPTSQTGLLAYYMFNETSGTNADNAEETIGYDGTLVSFSFNTSTPSMGIMLGDGSPSDPYQVRYISNLNWIINNSSSWGENFIQMNDIDASSTSTWNGNDGLFGIGNSTTKFTGTYDGGNYAISNIECTHISNHQGLFGYADGCIIKNLGVTDATIDCWEFVGIIGGYFSNSEIINCYSSGTINGNRNVGGICGYFINGVISGCYSTATITAGYNAGTLCGVVDASKIINCYTRGAASTSSGVSGNAGGLVGVSMYSVKYYNSYSTSTVSTVTGALGGFIAENYQSTSSFYNCFWDNTQTGITAVGVGSDAGITSTTSATMKLQSTYENVGWDFTSPIWAIDGVTNGGYPNLESNTSPISWIGSNTGWGTSANWSTGAVPTATDNVSIPGNSTYNPTFYDNRQCNNIVINNGDNSPGKVTIYNTGTLTVNGNLTNNGTFVVNSGSDGTGSLIVEGTATGDVIMGRYIAGTTTWDDWEDAWHFLSSPVADYPIQDNFTVATADEYDFYAWSEPYNLWINFKTGNDPTFITVNGSDDFELGHGYMAAYKTTDAKDFIGTINVNDIDVTGLSITGTTQSNRSWHLLGNPFTSGLTWYTDWTTNGNIVSTAKIWNESGKSYTDITAGSTIPATNGFMVQASGGTGTLTIPKAKRIHGGTFYKSAEFPTIKLKASNHDSPSFQESQLLFNPESTNNWDLEFDSDFLAGYAPLFYSKINGEPMAVNSMPNVEETTTIPFTFIKNEGLNFSIEMYESENMEMDVLLFDNKLNKDHNLTQNPVYFFTAFENDSPERFNIHFSPLGIDEPTTTQLIQTWASNSTINIFNEQNLSGDVKVVNMYGQTIINSKLSGDVNQQIMLAAPSGYYIINIVTNKGVVNKKVYLR